MANIAKWLGSAFQGSPTPSSDEKIQAVLELLSPEVSDVQKASFLTMISSTELNDDMLNLFSQAILQTSVPLGVSTVTDIVGTGGDGKNTWNISTPASLVAAGAGIRVAKHGNRSATSNSGSADLLEQLGANLDVAPNAVPAIVDKANFCFLFAQKYHPSMQHVAKVRKELGMKTIFNLLGPLLNPGRPEHMIIGCSSKEAAPVMAKVLGCLPNMKRAAVVHSADGMDKISPVCDTHAWIVNPGAEPKYELWTPADFGLSYPPNTSCSEGGGTPTHNATELLRVLRGDVKVGPLRDFVLVQAAALAYVQGSASTLKKGMEQMRTSVDSGKAMECLDEYVRLSTKLSKGGPVAAPSTRITHASARQCPYRSMWEGKEQANMRAGNNVLERIVRRRQVDLQYAQSKVSEADLRAMKYFAQPSVDLGVSLNENKTTPFGVMAEIKRASPSEGDINTSLDFKKMVTDYASGGAVALSVLTEPVWFKGDLCDLEVARDTLEALGAAKRPAILRKDFVFSKYQILEAKAHGADSVLLIVAIEYAMKQHGESVKSLVEFSQSLGMKPLVEVVTEAEVDVAMQAGASIIGINNRDLQTFKIDMGRTEMLMRYAEYTYGEKIDAVTWVSLSGVNNTADIQAIRQTSQKVRTVLVGTSLMRSSAPADLLKRLSAGTLASCDVAASKVKPTRPLFKCCGLKTPAQVVNAVRDGVDFVGLMFYPKSHRYIEDTNRAKTMADLVHKAQGSIFNKQWGMLPQSVGVFVKESADHINKLAQEVGFDMVQLYGYQKGDIDISALKTKDGKPMQVIWTVSVSTKEDMAALSYPDGIAALCVDRKVGDQVGGTGVSFDWDLLKGLESKVPLFLAGGIDETNAAAAAEVPGVSVVDISSGVETDKVKDFLKIRTVGRLIKKSINPYYGRFGGQFVPEILMPALIDLERQYMRVYHNQDFWKDVRRYWREYAGRPTLLYKAQKLTDEIRENSPPGMGANVWFKREDLLHTGAHKINNALGQALLAKWLGKRRMIAETGAGQHGVATATVCALFGLECVVYMGATDTVRQRLNVLRMEALGAKVVAVTSGQQTLNDAVNEALREWATSSHHTHYMIGSCVGPHPFPTMVRDFQGIISEECRAQCIQDMGSLPDKVYACCGGGSNSIGMFDAFVNDESVEIVGVEAGGDGKDMNSATLSKGTVGVVHGARSFLLQDAKTGQVKETHSVSAGLDYPGVGPEHSYLKHMDRVRYTAIDDHTALEGFKTLSRTEGVLAALETSHAVASIIKEAHECPQEMNLVCCMSGRGDKDMNTIADWLANGPPKLH